ncbi:MAG: hypothetical protein CM15mP102_10930 [Flavobacteriales bacterium]|nr:MAG: hypothetical protein CM15mP102_10930 [Flavobacteriales bacterium]
MNNILNYKGYRFFKLFDPDERGTVLSVNNDFWGTFITYAGYLLLFVSMTAIFFVGNTRFKFLAKQLNRKTSLVIFLFIVNLIIAQSLDVNLKLNSSIQSFQKVPFPRIMLAALEKLLFRIVVEE